MDKTQFGLKIGPNVTLQYLESVYDSADFVEAYAHPDCDYELLKDFDKLITLHVIHSDHGTNFANPAKNEHNQQALNHALKLADRFGSTMIVFHPELYETPDCTVQSLKDFLGDSPDERLHVENMPFNCHGVQHMGASAQQVAEILAATGVKFCLDFAHALEFLLHQRTDRAEIQSYLDLKPNHFHVTDTVLEKVHDPNFDELHVSFGDGTMDLAWVASLIPVGAHVTLETPMDADKHLRELALIREWASNSKQN